MNEIIPLSQTGLTIAGPQALDQNPAVIYLAGLKPSGRRSMRQALDLVAVLLGTPNALACPWPELRYEHVTAIRAKLEETYKPATVNKILAAIRGVMRTAWLAGQMNADEYHQVAAIKGVKNTTLPAGRELSTGEITALMAACENDPTPAGARDAALIALAYSCGLRREELAGLELADYDPRTGVLVVRGTGSKERTAYLVNGAAQAMADWLTLRGNQAGALFHPINKGGHILPQAMTPQAVYNLLQKRADEAGVKEFSPHDLRRSFVSDMLEAGADIATVAKMAGHANVQTTARYDRRPEENSRSAAGLLHVPYRGRLVR